MPTIDSTTNSNNIPDDGRRVLRPDDATIQRMINNQLTTISRNIASSVDAYIDSHTYTIEQQDVIRRFVCHFVYGYMASNFSRDYVDVGANNLRQELHSSVDIQQCRDIINCVVSNIPLD